MKLLRKVGSEVVLFFGQLFGIEKYANPPLPDDYKYKPGDYITYL